MITKEKALEVAIKTLKSKEIEFVNIDSVDDIRFRAKEDLTQSIPYGNYYGQKIDIYSITYTEQWGLDERAMGIDINAETGEAMYIITPHSFLEI
jgi:hypothetical protein